MDVFSDKQESSRVSHDQLFKELLTMFFCNYSGRFLNTSTFTVQAFQAFSSNILFSIRSKRLILTENFHIFIFLRNIVKHYR